MPVRRAGRLRETHTRSIAPLGMLGHVADGNCEAGFPDWGSHAMPSDTSEAVVALVGTESTMRREVLACTDPVEVLRMFNAEMWRSLPSNTGPTGGRHRWGYCVRPGSI